MKHIFVLLACLGLAAPAQAAVMDRHTRDFIGANLIAIYYHEFGHALIDIMKLPIFGQEEDAADVLSVLLVDSRFQERRAVEIADATATVFLGEHNSATSDGGQVDYWDVHGPDLQRYYTFICLFYGANPDARREFASKRKLPDGRRETCEEEFRQARDSWGPVLKKLISNGAGRTIRFLADYRVDQFGKLTADVISGAVATLNADLSLPKRLLVRVEPCDTANAFYDPKLREIVMCTEFASHLAGLAPN